MYAAIHNGFLSRFEGFGATTDALQRTFGDFLQILFVFHSNIPFHSKAFRYRSRAVASQNSAPDGSRYSYTSPVCSCAGLSPWLRGGPAHHTPGRGILPRESPYAATAPAGGSLRSGSEFPHHRCCPPVGTYPGIGRPFPHSAQKTGTRCLPNKPLSRLFSRRAFGEIMPGG